MVAPSRSLAHISNSNSTQHARSSSSLPGSLRGRSISDDCKCYVCNLLIYKIYKSRMENSGNTSSSFIDLITKDDKAVNNSASTNFSAQFSLAFQKRMLELNRNRHAKQSPIDLNNSESQTTAPSVHSYTNSFVDTRTHLAVENKCVSPLDLLSEVALSSESPLKRS